VRTAILVLFVSLFASACAPAVVRLSPSAAVPDRPMVAAAAATDGESEITLEIAELI
jgi:hypothetical protein